MATDTDAGTPESVDIREAAALMTDAEAEETPEEAAADSKEPLQEETKTGQPEGEAAESEEETGLVNEAPDFWSAEDKARWSEVPEDLRPVLHKYERQRIAYAEKKSQDAALARQEAVGVANAAGAMVEQAAKWWEQNGPAIRKAVADKWSGIDWKSLAEKDPEGVQRLIQQRQEEETLLTEAERRGQAEVKAARERAEQEMQAARRTEHAKLADKLPEYFGPNRARQTYDALSRFLFEKGIPADRIAQIYEAPVIELALAAMRWERARHALQSRDRGEGGGNTAKTTPTRIPPGPATAPGNRARETARQVGERFRQSGGASIADAAELIRLNNL
jgi:hypothetical protein